MTGRATSDRVRLADALYLLADRLMPNDMERPIRARRWKPYDGCTICPGEDRCSICDPGGEIKAGL